MPQFGFCPTLSLLVVSGHTSAVTQSSLYSEALLPRNLKRYSFHERLHAIVRPFRHPPNLSSPPRQHLPLSLLPRLLSRLSPLQLVYPMLSCHHSHCNSRAARTRDQCVRSTPPGVAVTHPLFLHHDLLPTVALVVAPHIRTVADYSTADFAAAGADSNIPLGFPLDHRTTRPRARLLPPPSTKVRL